MRTVYMEIERDTPRFLCANCKGTRAIRPRQHYNGGMSSSSSESKGARWASAVQIGLLAMCLFLACCFPMQDTDFWWHLRTGELIWERGELPDLDWYTFTDFDKPWVDLHWGFQLFVTAVWHLGGANLTVLVKAGVYTLAVLLAVSAAGRELPGAFRAGLWLLPAIAISGRAYERPEMLSLVFLAAWFWILNRAEHAPKRLWWLVPLQVLWTNCHALSVLGLVTFGCYAADRLVRSALVRDAATRWGLSAAPAHAPNLLLLAVAIAATAFANPWFDEGAFFPLVLYRKFTVDREAFAAIGEFQRPFDFYMKHGFANAYFLVEAWLWLVTALSFLFIWARGRWSVFRLLMFVGFSSLAWSASRNTSIFSIVAGLVLCENAGELWGASSLLPRWRSRFADALAGGMVLVLLGMIVSGTWSNLMGERKRLGLGERPNWFAHEAVQFAGREGMPGHALLYHNGLGGVYVYHHGPQRKVFMDARLEVTTPRTFRWYEEISRKMRYGDPTWTSGLRNAAGDLPVVVLDSRFSRLEIVGLGRTSLMRLVYADKSAAVFLETRIAERLKLPEADPRPLIVPPPD